MKKISVLATVVFLLLYMTACSSDDEKETAIIVNNQQALQQVAYADETQGENSVSFTTVGPWHSVITTQPSTRAEGTGSGSDTDWVSISPDSGDKAATYSISITLEPNYSGSKRSATIQIICGDSKITITITQEGTKEDGTLPEPEKPSTQVGLVKKINGESVTYEDINSSGVLIATQIGSDSYFTKFYSATEWAYVIGKDNYNRNWSCDYEYGHLGHLSKTTRYLTSHESANYLAEYHWDNDKLAYIRGDQIGVNRGDYYLRTNLKYGSAIYTQGNIDINWLLAASEYYTGLPTSAIGVKTTKNEKLLIEKAQIGEDGSDKYNYIYTYRYVFNEDGYLIEIYETTKHASYEDVTENEQLIYTFEY